MSSTEEQAAITLRSCDLLVITYRDHHHAYTQNDGSGATIDQMPLKKSLHQRFMQGALAFIMVHYLQFGMVFAALHALLWYMGYWYIPVLFAVAYLPSFLDNSQYKVGREWHTFRRWSMWHHISRYLQLEVVRTKKLDPSKRYMFAMYPHGILVLSRCGIYGGLWEKLFPGVAVKTLGASPMFYVPFGGREICLWLGAVDANRKTAERILTKHNFSEIVYPGGSQEIFHVDPTSKETVLVARKGFIKLAIQTGTQVVPTFVFGEKWMFHRYVPGKAVVHFFLKVLRIPLILFWGRIWALPPLSFLLPWMPLRGKGLSIVYGSPIEVTQNATPSDGEIDVVYEAYMKQIQLLFDTYKSKYGYDEQETLRIIEAQAERKKK